ncbi:MAG: hypothetical protein ACI4BG_08670, partial [Prevotella sp.]
TVDQLSHNSVAVVTQDGWAMEDVECAKTQYIKIGDKGERIAPISYAEWLLFIFAPTPTVMEQP